MKKILITPATRSTRATGNIFFTDPDDTRNSFYLLKNPAGEDVDSIYLKQSFEMWAINSEKGAVDLLQLTVIPTKDKVQTCAQAFEIIYTFLSWKSNKKLLSRIQKLPQLIFEVQEKNIALYTEKEIAPKQEQKSASS